MSSDKSGLLRSLRLDDRDRNSPARSEPADEADFTHKNRDVEPIRASDPASAGHRKWLIPAAAGALGVIIGCLAILLVDPMRQSEPGSVQSVATKETQPDTQTTAPIDQSLVASGYVVARRQATVAAEITGRLVDVRFEEGQYVEQGQVLAVLDRSIAVAELEMSKSRQSAANANIAASAAEVTDADGNLDRTRQLHERGFATRANLDGAEARASSARARLAEARATANLAASERQRTALQVDQHTIRAPFSGVVISKNAQTGEIISPISAGGGFTRTGIATLVDINSLEFEVDVSEQYISRVRPGQAVSAQLNAYPERDYRGRVIATVPTADRNRSTVRVRIGFENQDNEVLPDMAVRVTFLPEE